ncbi:MAG: flagellar biosynthetic protein FliO [Halobacteriovoraceae bacterium]|nr:flagellar biosynthetic protein FliO [Halobacteriovoraceae bacterium]MCB9094202.1 flagellar biosynthetic protein FliO [Halobacteriovoraceae bacterium]
MKLVILTCILFSINSWSKVFVDKVTEIDNSSQTKIKISLSDFINENPLIKASQNQVSLRIPNVIISPKVQYHLKNKENIHVTQDNNDIVLTVETSKKIRNLSENVNVDLKDKDIYLKLPQIHIAAQKIKAQPVIKSEVSKPINIAEKKVLAQSKAVVSNDKVDEEHLRYLVEDFEKVESAQTKRDPLLEDKIAKETVVDKVQEKFGANEKANKIIGLKEGQDFQIYTYILKILVVLLCIIGVFLVGINFFRKKVLNKTKLGFLNNTKLVEVISTTYIAPKKNLILIKAHEQYLLLSSTENSINLITEIKDPMGLLKMGEKEVTGENFDTNLDLSSEMKLLSENVKLKDANKIYESTPVKNSKSQSFSDHIKKNVKKLKPLQQS